MKPAVTPAMGPSTPAPPLPIEAIFLRRIEAARALGINASLSAKLTARGEVKSVKIGKRAVRYRPADLQARADRQAAQMGEIKQRKSLAGV